LGCGGNSRLGQGPGKSAAESADIIRQAIDLGVNLIDTAEAYGTEAIVGAGIKSVPRDRVVISTKSGIRRGDKLLPVDRVIANLDQSLKRLDTDYIDVFHLHAVQLSEYDQVVDRMVPALLREIEKGKFRHLGITERASRDSAQSMLQRAAHDEFWEVMMLAFHMMAQNARAKVFPHTLENNIGTLLMFVVRNIFSKPEQLRDTMAALARDGQLPDWLGASDDPLGFLVHDAGASSIMDAAYRFARHEPGADVVLFGTGNRDHLQTNIESILRPPLPQADRDKLAELFGSLTGVGLDAPDHLQKKR
jgi:aryl-alcohol dehydrogenase-like predicted oxidoreductase